jgi:tRNA U34 5-carboxymethylaminomethyl modifying GTPase MnmE/TrmE
MEREIFVRKQEIVSALELLPDTIIVSKDEEISRFTEIHIKDEVASDITYLNDSFEFFEDYQSKFVIALVGMVNAGKSALGNFYANKRESELFEEAPIRQTSQASQAEIDRDRILIDLPGLGSVLSEEDDLIVKNIIQRANLLLIVIGLNQPISNHLYQFLKSDEILKNWEAQRIVIVLNKMDILDVFPEAHRKKNLDQFVEFLKNGNPDLGFPGISNLFDGEIPIVPFSVIHARNGINQWREVELRKAISQSLEGSENTCQIRAIQELTQMSKKYSSIVLEYIKIKQKKEQIVEVHNATISRFMEDAKKIISLEVNGLLETIVSLRNECFDTMQGLQPNSAELFWRGDQYQYKQERLKSCRNQYQNKIRSSFDNFSINFRDDLTYIIQGAFGHCDFLELPNKKRVNDALDLVIYKIWDAFDDVFFLDYNADGDRVRGKLEQSETYIKLAASEIIEWKDFLVSIALDEAQNQVNSQTSLKIKQYNLACESLESFCQSLISTQAFQEWISSSE